MRILMTTDTVGGVWTYALELARALLTRNVQIDLATMGPPPRPEQREAVKRLPNVVLWESSWRLEWMDSPWEDVEQAGAWLLELGDRVLPDLVHLNGYVHGSLPWRCPVLVIGHSCVLSWWEAVRGQAAPPEWDRYRTEVRRGLQAADHVVAPTQAMLDALIRHYGPLAGPVANRFGQAKGPAKSHATRIFNGRDRRGLYPGVKEPFVMSVGRLWDEAKNVAAVEEAASGLAWPVYVAGPDGFQSGDKTSIRHCRQLGELGSAELAGWLNRASIFALPARYEPFGLSALEAGLSGCALVLGDIPSLREVWGDAALFIPPREPEALRAVLNRLIQDDRLRGEMGSRARDRAILYTPQRMADGYVEIYGKLLSQPAGVATASGP